MRNTQKTILMAVILISHMLLGMKAFSQDQLIEKNDKLSKQKSENDLPLEEIKIFVDVFMQIKNRYVDEISDKELIEKAIKGMVEGLDPYSEYLGTTTYETLTNDTKGQFGGVGVTISLTEGGILVNSALENSPAKDVDIREGDLIVKISNTSTKGMSLKEAKNIMRGNPGSQLSLWVKRGEESALIEKKIIREVIQIETISSAWLSNEIAYVRLSQFHSASAARLREKIFDFQNSSTNTFKGLIFDLRNNPGGLLTTAVSVSDIFLDSGKIVSTKSRHMNNGREDYKASPKDFTNGVPIVVLINNGSASASEIVSGALQDNGRAKIIGTQSYGKGSVQSLINLSDARALKLTTGRYYTPSGISIHEKGINPDMVIELTEVENVISKEQYLKYDSQVQAGVKFLNSSL